MPLMDIQSGVIALVLLLVLFAVIGGRNGLRAIRAARKMTFYRLRRQTGGRGVAIVGHFGAITAAGNRTACLRFADRLRIFSTFPHAFIDAHDYACAHDHCGSDDHPEPHYY